MSVCDHGAPGMGLARKYQICVDQTPYYHCISRCVRQAFLCGNDRFTERNYDHRKAWLENRMRILSQVFAIDLVAYAIMSNHYHVVLRINASLARNWTSDEVVGRWQVLFSLPEVVREEDVRIWRDRLCSISWYQRCLNEPLARMANREDNCAGRFWEGRFKCQALLDERALITCMAYVDLNPVRAATATTPESSEHTSVRARIAGDDDHLMPFSDDRSANGTTIPCNERTYLELVDWTGRQIRHGKRGRIDGALPPILQRLCPHQDDWLREMKYYGRWYYRAVGSIAAMSRFAEYVGQQWLKGRRETVALAT